MDGIQELVHSVVRQCASRGVSVSEVLAAFVARTVSFSRNSLKQAAKLKMMFVVLAPDHERNAHQWSMGSTR